MKRLLPGLIPLLLLLSSLQANAQDASASSAAPASDNLQDRDLPYQITITRSPTRRDLRLSIERTQNDFIARFNELNMDDEFDIHCYEDEPTLSHITQRTCEPYFFTRARADNANESAFLLGNPYGSRSVFLDSHRGLLAKKRTEFEVLQEKVNELVASDDQLAGIALVLGELKRRLENFGKED